MSEYEVYEPSEPPDEDGPWQVIIEHHRLVSGGTDRDRPQLVIGRKNVARRDEALEEARRLAFEFQPPDPWSERGRRVFRCGDEFIVDVDGATLSLPFRVFVAQYLESADVGRDGAKPS